MPPTSLSVERLILHGLDEVTNAGKNILWQPYRDGVDIHRLYGDGKSGPLAALLRYAPDARIPLHEHQGYEHIYVLSGSQTDGHGVYKKGTLVIHKPGTQHQLHSEEGCVVLAIYEKPVKFINEET